MSEVHAQQNAAALEVKPLVDPAEVAAKEAAAKEAAQKAKEETDAKAKAAAAGTEEADEGDGSAAADTEVSAEEDGEVKFLELEDRSAEAAIDIMRDAGITAREANAFFEAAITAGDPSLIDWKLIEERVGPAKATSIKALANQSWEQHYKPMMDTVKKVHESFGGEKNWDKVREWSNKKAATDPEYKAVEASLRQALQIPGETAVIAANRLKELYQADPKNGGLGKDKLLMGDARAAAVEPLSRMDYYKLRSAAKTDAEVASLIQRREAGRKAGI